MGDAVYFVRAVLAFVFLIVTLCFDLLLLTLFGGFCKHVCRRQGYFHETIGDVTKDSYRDAASAQQAQLKLNASASFSGAAASSTGLNQSQRTQNTQNTANTTSTGVAKFLQEALVSPKGSVSLSPQKAGRRQSWGPHMSR